MDNTNNYSDQIEKYLDGELSPAEVTAFEKALEQDAELKEEFAFYEMAHDAIISNKLYDIEETVKAAGKAHASKAKKKKVYQNILFGSLALLTLGATGIFVAADQGKEKVPQEKPVSPQINTQEEKGEAIEVIEIENDQAEKKGKAGSANETNTNKAVKDEGEIPASTDQKEKEGTTTTGKTTKESNSTSQNAMNDLCEGVDVTATFNMESTCSGKTQGSIALKHVNGGVAPYSYILSNGQESKNGTFSNLPQGTYSVYVADANACGTMVDGLVITSKSCKIDLYLDLASGKGATFPAYEKAGELAIFDKQGQLKEQKKIAAGQQLEWTNTTSLPAGYYLFTIEYEDGNSQSGSLTIMP